MGLGAHFPRNSNTQSNVPTPWVTGNFISSREDFGRPLSVSNRGSAISNASSTLYYPLGNPNMQTTSHIGNNYQLQPRVSQDSDASKNNRSWSQPPGNTQGGCKIGKIRKPGSGVVKDSLPVPSSSSNGGSNLQNTVQVSTIASQNPSGTQGGKTLQNLSSKPNVGYEIRVCPEKETKLDTSLNASNTIGSNNDSIVIAKNVNLPNNYNFGSGEVSVTNRSVLNVSAIDEDWKSMSRGLTPRGRLAKPNDSLTMLSSIDRHTKLSARSKDLPQENQARGVEWVHSMERLLCRDSKSPRQNTTFESGLKLNLSGNKSFTSKTVEDELKSDRLLSERQNFASKLAESRIEQPATQNQQIPSKTEQPPQKTEPDLGELIKERIKQIQEKVPAQKASNSKMQLNVGGEQITSPNARLEYDNLKSPTNQALIKNDNANITTEENKDAPIVRKLHYDYSKSKDMSIMSSKQFDQIALLRTSKDVLSPVQSQPQQTISAEPMVHTTVNALDSKPSERNSNNGLLESTTVQPQTSTEQIAPNLNQKIENEDNQNQETLASERRIEEECSDIEFYGQSARRLESELTKFEKPFVTQENTYRSEISQLESAKSKEFVPLQIEIYQKALIEEQAFSRIENNMNANVENSIVSSEKSQIYNSNEGTQRTEEQQGSEERKILNTTPKEAPKNLSSDHQHDVSEVRLEEEEQDLKVVEYEYSLTSTPNDLIKLATTKSKKQESVCSYNYTKTECAQFTDESCLQSVESLGNAIEKSTGRSNEQKQDLGIMKVELVLQEINLQTHREQTDRSSQEKKSKSSSKKQGVEAKQSPAPEKITQNPAQLKEDPPIKIEAFKAEPSHQPTPKENEQSHSRQGLPNQMQEGISDKIQESSTIKTLPQQKILYGVSEKLPVQSNRYPNETEHQTMQNDENECEEDENEREEEENDEYYENDTNYEQNYIDALYSDVNGMKDGVASPKNGRFEEMHDPILEAKTDDEDSPVNIAKHQRPLRNDRMLADKPQGKLEKKSSGISIHGTQSTKQFTPIETEFEIGTSENQEIQSTKSVTREEVQPANVTKGKVEGKKRVIKKKANKETEIQR